MSICITSGPVARSDARPPGMRTFAGSILGSGKILGHEIIFTAFLILLLVRPGQFSVTGEKMCT